MKKTIVSLVIIFLIATGFAQTSHSKSHSSSRPSYSGSKHTTSHGGHYSGGSLGSSHKGGHYTAPNGYKGYGTHRSKK